MSLIHEALKKLEGTKVAAGCGGGRGIAPQTVSAAAPSWAKRLLAVVALVAVLVSAGAVFVYLGRTGPEPVGPTAQGKSGVEAANGTRPVETLKKETPAEVKNAASLNEEGVFSYKTGRYAEAASRLKAAVAAEPDNAVYRNNYALSLMRSGKNDEADSEFRRAIELMPAYPEALANYGTLLASRGDHGAALGYFERALVADGSYAAARINMAVSLELMGRTRDAITSYEDFLELNEDAELGLKVRKKVARLRSALIIEERSGKRDSR